MKGKTSPLIIALTIAVLLPILVSRSFFLSPSPKDTRPRPFIISRGASASAVANQLEKEKLIKSALAFKLAVKFRGLSQKIEAGEYQLSPSLSLGKLIEVLQKGAPDIWVTLPEGLRKEEIATRVANMFVNFDPDQFILQATAPQNLEGYLFPDTYQMPKSSSPTAVIKILNSTFHKKTSLVLDNRTNGLTKNDTVILASLLEREARTIDDKKIISGILVKRNRAGWALDIDATLQYINGTKRCGQQKILDPECKWWLPVSPQDKKTLSPYNTYAHRGFPPAPISNPGLDSIKAASNPVNSEFWFYLSDSNGQTRFARSLEEHQANIDKYL